MLSNDVVEADGSTAADELVREIVTGQPFSPREETGREGVLIVGQPSKRRPRAVLRAIALDPLTDLVQQVTHWGEDRVDLEARVGDCRSLILDFRLDDGLLLYVQVWSTPLAETQVIVGTDDVDGESRKAFIESAGEPLRSRGFDNGRTAGCFRKLLPLAKPEDPVRIAREMLGLLTDVLGYDGTAPLVYRLRQATALRAAHVMYGITRLALQNFLRVWGVESTAPPDDASSLNARSHGINFRIHLFTPSRSAPDVHWEVHCSGRFPIPRERVAGLLAEVNGNAWLLKAHVLPESDGGGTTDVRLCYGFNLAGGVTPDHLKDQFFGWLACAHRLWSEWGRPVAARMEETEDRAAETVH
jgi:hypothetical protein